MLHRVAAWFRRPHDPRRMNLIVRCEDGRYRIWLGVTKRKRPPYEADHTCDTWEAAEEWAESRGYSEYIVERFPAPIQ
jgi:hypothetical protein